MQIRGPRDMELIASAGAEACRYSRNILLGLGRIGSRDLRELGFRAEDRFHALYGQAAESIDN